MRLYNSRTGTTDELPIRDGRASMYVCGITPYDVTHLGHAFTYLTFDVLRRRLESRGVLVRHVQNITDIDDDVIRKARELGTTVTDLVETNVRWFDGDMRALGALPPHVSPRATEEIPGIQAMIGRLITAGQAYTANGDVYFAVRTYPAYGSLSRLSAAEMAAENERQNMRPGPRDPLDFLLWQAMAPGEPFWESPWGPGRPGWHIECSAMALAHAGETLDVHGGGRDLIFPHHESEIAQSESYTGVAPFVRCWAHVGMIRYEGEKMSKSLGNLVLVRDLLKTYTPDAVRLSLLAIHYRESREWTHDLMTAAAEQAERLRTAVATPSGAGEPLDAAPFVARFEAALDNDLDTPAAVVALLELAERVTTAGNGRSVSAARQQLQQQSAIIGLRLSEHE